MKGLLYLIAVIGLFSLTFSPMSSAQEVQSEPPYFLDPMDEFLDDTFREYSLDDEGEVTIDVGGQFRHRLELRNDFNFNDDTFEDDAINLLRTRLQVTLKITPYVKVFAQGQDSESFADRGAHRSRSFVNRLDLHQLWAEFKSPVEEFDATVKVGRQKLAYGDQRFVGGFEWSNVARVFDAVKLVLKPHEKFQLDAWFSQVVPVNRSQADSANHSDNFWGIYGILTPIENHTLDTFIFFRDSRGVELSAETPGVRGGLFEVTYGNRFVGKKSGFDYGFEWAVQAGERAEDDIQAWALHSRVGYTAGDIAGDPRLSFEYNHGSGDSDPTDGKIQTFDNLFPTNHLHYGYMDFFSLRNTHNYKVGLDFKPHDRIKFIANYHWFFLDTSSGLWQNAGGGAVRARTPGADGFVGEELDLLAKWKLSGHLGLLIGYSHFFTGDYVSDTGASSDADFFYVQTTLNF